VTERCRERNAGLPDSIDDCCPCGCERQAWDALRDVGAIHIRLVPGFVLDTKLEPGARVVTFANGVVAREVIIDIDDTKMRVAWSASGGRLSHHNASAQVFPEAGGSRIVWIADLLPNEMRAPIEAMITEGMAAMKRTLDKLGNG